MRSKSFLVHVATGGLASRINPLSKILVLLVMNALVFFTVNPILIGIYFIVSAALLVSAGIPVKAMKAYFGGVSFMVVICFLTYTFLSGTPGNLLWHFWFLRVTDASLMRGVILALRVASLVIIMITYMCIANQQEIILGMRELRIPYPVCFLVALAFRFAAIFPEDINIIMQAQKARGVDFHKGGLIQRIRSWVSIGLPVVATYLSHVQTFSNALECHGYKISQPRQFFRVVKYGTYDYLVIAALAVLVAIRVVFTV